MKVALVVPGGVDRSGERRVIPALLALLRRLSMLHELHVFATHQENEPSSWILEGAHVHNVGLPRTLWRTANAIVREHRTRPFDVLQSFWSGRHGVLAVGAGAFLRVPSVVHVAGGELVALQDIHYGGCCTWRGRVRERWVLRGATAVTCASQPIVDSIAERGVRAQRLPLGVDLSRWPVRAPVRRSGDEPARLLHVASLNGVKDQPTLLHALRRLADAGRSFEVDVVGEDTLDGRIQALAEQLGLARVVRFHGFLTHRELRPLVEAAHVALLSSRHEAGPLVLLEAAVAGVPTVGTAVGHLAEWSPDAALAVPCREPAALEAAIATLVDDEDLRLRVAAAAQRNAALEDADHSARGFDAIYRRVAAAGTTARNAARERRSA
jgi:glycosyltransferase involved in cell wall biosynthesis